MVTAIWIILADVLVLLLFVYQYRQELGLTVNGSHDLPVMRKKPTSKQAAPPAVGDPPNRGQRVGARQ